MSERTGHLEGVKVGGIERGEGRVGEEESRARGEVRDEEKKQPCVKDIIENVKRCKE